MEIRPLGTFGPEGARLSGPSRLLGSGVPAGLDRIRASRSSPPGEADSGTRTHTSRVETWCPSSWAMSAFASASPPLFGSTRTPFAPGSRRLRRRCSGRRELRSRRIWLVGVEPTTSAPPARRASTAPQPVISKPPLGGLRWRDSNPRPPGYEPGARPLSFTASVSRSRLDGWDSNPRSPHSKCGSLPLAHRPSGTVLTGFEPVIFWATARRPLHWTEGPSTVPIHRVDGHREVGRPGSNRHPPGSHPGAVPLQLRPTQCTRQESNLEPLASETSAHSSRAPGAFGITLVPCKSATPSTISSSRCQTTADTSGGIRTHSLPIRSRVLFQLSFGRVRRTWRNEGGQRSRTPMLVHPTVFETECPPVDGTLQQSCKMT